MTEPTAIEILPVCAFQSGAPQKKEICAKCLYLGVRSCRERLMFDAHNEIKRQREIISALSAERDKLKCDVFRIKGQKSRVNTINDRFVISDITKLVECIIADSQRKEIYRMMTREDDIKGDDRETQQILVVSDALAKIFPDDERARVIIQTDIREGRSYERSRLCGRISKAQYYRKRYKLIDLVAKGLGVKS